MTVKESSPSEKPKRRRWFRNCLVSLLLLICLLGALAGGGYWAIQSGRLSGMQLQAQISGVSNITVYNLSDQPVSIELNQLDTGEEGDNRSRETLDSFDSSGFGAVGPGRYRLDFETSGFPPSQSCTLQISRGSEFIFLIVPEGIAVSNAHDNLSTAADLIVETSRLCQK